VVRWAIEEELEIDIYGGDWESFIKDRRLKGQSVPNEVLGELYGSSRLVLCDHWKDMANCGFLSNRVYDVLASGGFLVTDTVEGIAELLPAGSYSVFTNARELADLVRGERPVDLAQRAANAAWVAENHSFRARARDLMAIVAEHPKSRAHANAGAA
jgi:spore maturation protein CgeB